MHDNVLGLNQISVNLMNNVKTLPILFLFSTHFVSYSLVLIGNGITNVDNRIENKLKKCIFREKWHICLLENQSEVLKGIVHPKMKILSLVIHPHVVRNP